MDRHSSNSQNNSSCSQHCKRQRLPAVVSAWLYHQRRIILHCTIKMYRIYDRRRLVCRWGCHGLQMNQGSDFSDLGRHYTLVPCYLLYILVTFLISSWQSYRWGLGPDWAFQLKIFAFIWLIEHISIRLTSYTEIIISAWGESSVRFLEIPVEFRMHERGSWEQRIYNIVLFFLISSAYLL